MIQTPLFEEVHDELQFIPRVSTKTSSLTKSTTVTDPRKKLIYDVANNNYRSVADNSGHWGTIKTRLAKRSVNDFFINGPKPKIQLEDEYYKYVADRYTAHVVFAARSLGGGYRDNGWVQEEIITAEFVEMFWGIQMYEALNLNVLQANESVIWFNLTKNSRALKYGGRNIREIDPAVFDPHEFIKINDQEASLINFISIDAPRRENRESHYSLPELQYLIVKALSGFTTCMAYGLSNIYTGNWGAGAFNNDYGVIYLIQITAAWLSNISRLVFLGGKDITNANDKAKILAVLQAYEQSTNVVDFYNSVAGRLGIRHNLIEIMTPILSDSQLITERKPSAFLPQAPSIPPLSPVRVRGPPAPVRSPSPAAGAIKPIAAAELPAPVPVPVPIHGVPVPVPVTSIQSPSGNGVIVEPPKAEINPIFSGYLEYDLNNKLRTPGPAVPKSPPRNPLPSVAPRNPLPPVAASARAVPLPLPSASASTSARPLPLPLPLPLAPTATGTLGETKIVSVVPTAAVESVITAPVSSSPPRVRKVAPTVTKPLPSFLPAPLPAPLPGPLPAPLPGPLPTVPTIPGTNGIDWYWLADDGWRKYSDDVQAFLKANVRKISDSARIVLGNDYYIVSYNPRIKGDHHWVQTKENDTFRKRSVLPPNDIPR